MTADNLTNKEFLISLYSNYAQDEYELIKALENYLKFFSGLILTTIGAAFFIFKSIEDPIIKGIGFAIGGFFIIGISFLGYFAARSNYRRQLESIVKRFKIECLLGLDNPEIYSDDKYLAGEPLILDRYRHDFELYKKESSNKFVKDKLKAGFMRVVFWFYLLTCIIGISQIAVGLSIIF